MNKKGNAVTCGIDQLLEAAESLGDHPETNQQLHSDRNNFHGYARSPPERAYLTHKDRIRERKSDDRIRFEPKERQRPGGRIEHNRLEKDRRAQLKQNFNKLKEVVPTLKDKKTSNQAILRGSHRYILSLLNQQKRFEKEIQDLASEKSQLLRSLNFEKEKFEQTHGIPADDYLDSLHDIDDDDQASDTTLSATECPDNYNDFLDQDEVDVQPVPETSGSQQQMPPPPVPSSSLRGIPHPVIRQVPPVNQRLHPDSPQSIVSPVVPSAPSAIPRATAKKLQAKLTSTKQPPSAQDPTPASSPSQVTSPGPRPITVTSVGGNFIRPRIISTPPAGLPAGLSQVPITQGRVVGQSLLTPPPVTLGPTTLMPTLFHTTTTSSGGVVVPATVQAANTTLLSAGVPRFNRVGPIIPSIAPLKDCHMFPRVIVAAGDNYGQLLMNPPNVIVMSNTLPPQNTNPAVSTHVAL